MVPIDCHKKIFYNLKPLNDITFPFFAVSSYLNPPFPHPKYTISPYQVDDFPHQSGTFPHPKHYRSPSQVHHVPRQNKKQ
jgi:hypothetical protein